MNDTKTVEEKLNDLIEKNRDLANHVQFWRLEYKRVEDEKFQLQRDYNESLFRKKEAFSKLKKIHTLLEGQMFEFSNKLTAFEKIINDCDDSYQCTSRDIFSSSFQRDTPGNGVNVHYVPPMIKGVTLKTAVLVVPRANIDILNGSLNQSAKRDKLSRKSETPKNSPKNKISGTSTPKETKNKVELSSPQTSSDYNDINIPNSLGVLSKTSKKDPFVSLSRVDTFERKSPNDNIEKSNDDSPSVEESKLNIDEHQNNNKFCSISQDLSSENKENSYSNCEVFDDISSNEHLSNTPRLECIIEQTEIDPNSSNSSGFSSSITPKKRRILSSDFFQRNSTEDPLEGPSWLFKNDQDQNNQVEKIDDYSHDSLLENIKQLSNSNISESDDEKSEMIVPPQSQSTPKQIDNVIQDFTIKNNDNNFVIPENIVEQSRDTKIEEDKPIVTKNKKISKPKSLSKKKTTRISSKIKKTTSPIKRRSSNKKISGSLSLSSRENSLTSTDAVITTSRARRTNKVNYKEMSCTVKLRRN